MVTTYSLRINNALKRRHTIKVLRFFTVKQSSISMFILFPGVRLIFGTKCELTDREVAHARINGNVQHLATRRIALMRSDSLCSRICRRQRVKTAASHRRFYRISVHHYHAPS